MHVLLKYQCTQLATCIVFYCKTRKIRDKTYNDTQKVNLNTAIKFFSYSEHVCFAETQRSDVYGFKQILSNKLL